MSCFSYLPDKFWKFLGDPPKDKERGLGVMSGQQLQRPPGEGRSGAEILRGALGERSEHIGHILVSTDAEARHLADTVFDQRARGFVCAHGRAEGNPALRVGTHLRLTGVSQRFENTYYVVAACHRYDVSNGYQTTFRAECYALGRN